MGFTKFQKQVLCACFTVYFCAYIGRLNMSAALGGIIEDLKVTNTTAGLLQTLFSIAYASGQLLFGSLADRYPPRRLLLIGLIGSALMNALFALSLSFNLIALVWTVNGVFQSMLWTPIVRILAQNFDLHQRKAASLVMSFTLAAGHFFAWLLAGLMARRFSWRMSFAAPAFILALCALFACFALPRVQAQAPGAGRRRAYPPLGAPVRRALCFFLIGCVANGFVRDSVITWSPTILGAASDTFAFTLLIPLINLMGIMLGAYLVRRSSLSVRALIAEMMGAVALLSGGIFIFAPSSAVVLALFLGLISALLYGSNPLITTLTPMEYDWAGCVGRVAGMVDCSIYIGSALSGSLVGLIHDLTGAWSNIYLSWLAAAGLGALAVLISRGKRPA